MRWALELGYRHIDTAQAYGNEASVGKALRDSGVPRDEVFITTKFYPARKDPVAEAEQSLRKLGVDQVDLYLVHWPQRGPVWAWPGMERARERGLARSIGVSNFGAADLDQVIAAGSVDARPSTRSSSARWSTGAGCSRRACATASCSRPTARSAPAATSATRGWREIAARLGRTPAQVLLRWCLQHGVPVIPKSTHRERIEENAQIFDFTLSDEDMAALDALDKTHGTDRALESTWWR